MRPIGVFASISRTRAAVNDFLSEELARAGLAGLCPSHGDILSALFKEDGQAMGDLARAIRRKKNTATVLVSKLEGLGYVEAVRDAADGRRVLIRLTAAGRALKEPFSRISRRLHDKALKGIEEDRLEGLLSLLERIQGNLGA
jgi:DNA-binding MarR family transcriptional regulator